MIINCNKIKSSWYQLFFGSKLTTENSKNVLPSNQYSQASANSKICHQIAIAMSSSGDKKMNQNKSEIEQFAKVATFAH